MGDIPVSDHLNHWFKFTIQVCWGHNISGWPSFTVLWSHSRLGECICSIKWPTNFLSKSKSKSWSGSQSVLKATCRPRWWVGYRAWRVVSLRLGSGPVVFWRGACACHLIKRTLSSACNCGLHTGEVYFRCNSRGCSMMRTMSPSNNDQKSWVGRRPLVFLNLFWSWTSR